MSGVRTVLLKDICNFDKGSTGLMKAEPGEYPLVTTGAERRTCESYQFDTKAVCIPLVSSTGHGHASLNNVHYQEGKFALGTILVALTAKNEAELDVHFLHLYLSQLKDVVLVPLMKGAANVSLSITAVKSVEIPLPSIIRQQEIVEKFKSIVIQEKGLIEELNFQRCLLGELKLQIIQNAIEGKLTIDWREKNPETQSANELLNRLKNEKEKLTESRLMNKQKPSLPILNDDKVFELPELWEWCRLEDVAQLITSGSRGWAQYYSDSGAIFLTMGNLSKEHYNLRMDKIRYVKPPMNSEGARTRLFENDILISITGDVGNLGLIPRDFGEAYINQHTCVLRLMRECQGMFFPELLKSPFAKKQFSAPQRGVKNSFRLSDVGKLVIPLPPLEEQKEIANKISHMMNICDKLENKIIKNESYAELLMEIVLKEEFQQQQTVEQVN